MPKISVIVPIYNVEEYVLDCLKSVAAQTFQDFECVCVDDGSEDNSGKKVDDFAKKDKRFIVIHQKNGGLPNARNSGLKKATGEYIFFLDSDDYIHPQTFEILLNAAIKNDAKVVNCNAQNTSEKYKEKHQELELTHYKTTIINNPLNAFLTDRKIKTGVCFRLYKKELVDKFPFIEGIHFEDIPFTVRLLNEIDKMVLVDLPLYYYYKNPNSIMRSNFSIDKINSYDKIIRFLTDYFKKQAPQKLPMIKKRLFNQRIKMMLNQCVRKQKDKQKQEKLFEHAQKTVKELYKNSFISYRGLKLKHKATLYLLLKCKDCHLALKWCRIFN